MRWAKADQSLCRLSSTSKPEALPSLDEIRAEMLLVEKEGEGASKLI